MHILISACLLNIPCRYDGRGYPITTQLKQLMTSHALIPVCPERLGGLKTPRPPVELQGRRAVTSQDVDLTEAFLKGSAATLLTAQQYHCQYALLKDKSPSCGSSRIYDGSFTGRLVPGSGLTAALLREHGLTVWDETQLDSYIPHKFTFKTKEDKGI